MWIIFIIHTEIINLSTQHICTMLSRPLFRDLGFVRVGYKLGKQTSKSQHQLNRQFFIFILTFIQIVMTRLKKPSFIDDCDMPVPTLLFTAQCLIIIKQVPNFPAVFPVVDQFFVSISSSISSIRRYLTFIAPSLI